MTRTTRRAGHLWLTGAPGRRARWEVVLWQLHRAAAKVVEVSGEQGESVPEIGLSVGDGVEGVRVYDRGVVPEVVDGVAGPASPVAAAR
jgi:hypothetical protein